VGLDRARQLKAEVGDEVRAVGVVAEVLAEARQGLFRETDRSGSLSAGFRNIVAFVGGALGGGVGEAAAGVTGALIGATGGAISPLVSEALRQRTPGFVRRHYLLFDRAKSSPQ
jgi:hypothetical protein